MRFPRHMTLELTAKCNFRCPYCYCLWHEFPEIAKPELDTAGWKAILDKCADDEVEDILFTGGETLLRSDLFQILSYARRRLPRADLPLFTNASLLDEPLVKRLKRRRIRLATSLQGLTTYGAMTGTRPSGADALARRMERDKGRDPRPSRLRRAVHVLRRVLLRMPQRPAHGATAPEMARPQP